MNIASYSLLRDITLIINKKQQLVKFCYFSVFFKMFTVFKDETAVVENLQNLIETIANESINKREKFFVGFSGIFFSISYICAKSS